VGDHRPRRRGGEAIVDREVQWAVFLDRDGVINELVPNPATGDYESPYRPEDVRLTPTSGEALRLLGGLGVPLVVVSNQPSAAKGTATLADLEAVHERVVRRLQEVAVAVDDARYCFHHPLGADPELGRACECRKPEPGLLVAAADDLGLGPEGMARSWLIGDSDVDIEAGRRAGCQTVLVENPRSAHRRAGAEPDVRCADVLGAARAVVAAAPAPVSSRSHHVP